MEKLKINLFYFILCVGILFACSQKQILRQYIVEPEGHIVEIDENLGYVLVSFELSNPIKRQWKHRYIHFNYNKFQSPYLGQNVNLFNIVNQTVNKGNSEGSN